MHFNNIYISEAKMNLISSHLNQCTLVELQIAIIQIVFELLYYCIRSSCTILRIYHTKYNFQTI